MIVLENVGFAYAQGTGGVSDINLHVNAGECVVLIGRSGCGKSTLCRLINGLAPAFYKGTFKGRALVAGQDVSQTPSWELAQMVGSVFQDPKSQFFSSEMPGEVAFAVENLGFNHESVRTRTDQAIEYFGLEHLRTRSLDVLSSGEAQRVAIASVYAPAPRVFAMDEPTANLDAEGIERLAQTAAHLKRDGFTLLIAEHRLYWLDGIADRYVYLEDGRITCVFSAEKIRELPENERIRLGLRELQHDKEHWSPKTQGSNIIPEAEATQSYRDIRVSSTNPGLTYGPAPKAAAPLLVCKNLSCKRGSTTIWENLNLSLYPGDICALTGKNGAGKTTLGVVLAGLSKQSSGTIEIDKHATSTHARRRQVWFCSNNTATQFFTNSVEDELLLGTIPDADTLEDIRNLLRRLGLYDFRSAHPAALSGGQRQRLAIACALLSRRPILVFDEPTSGLDAANMEIIAHELSRAAHAGRTILVITHDFEFIRTCKARRIEIGVQC